MTWISDHKNRQKKVSHFPALMIIAIFGHFSKYRAKGQSIVKFVFSMKATKIDKIFTVYLTLTTQCQIDGEDFFQIFWPSQKTIMFEMMDKKKNDASEMI